MILGKLSQKFLRDNPSVSNDSLFAYLKVLLYRLPSDDLRNEFKICIEEENVEIAEKIEEALNYIEKNDYTEK